MARLVANIAIDPDDLDFEQFDGGVFSNDNATQGTQFQVAATAGGLPISISVTGDDFQYVNVPGAGEVPTTGVIDSISVDAGLFGDVFSLTGITRGANDEGGAFELTVEELLRVASTDKLSDDLALIREIFQGADDLVGSGGGDVLLGFAGDDTIVGGGGGDLMDGGFGQDTVTYAGSDGVTINLANPGAGAGDAQGDTLISVESIIGSAKKDVFVGSAGDDHFNGGRGKDRIDGGGGDDEFEFSVRLSKKNADRIENFDSGEDRLLLSVDIFRDVPGGVGKLDQDSFVIGAQASDAVHRIVYDQDTGKLFYDADGSGAGGQKLFATLDPGTDLSNSDIFLF